MKNSRPKSKPDAETGISKKNSKIKNEISKSDSQSTAVAPLSEMRSATLDKIEKAVRQLFAGNDANDITMIQIANTANVSLQTLYKYFGDKQTVLYTIMDIVLGRLAARMMDHLQGIDSVEDRLRKTLWVCLDFVDTQPDAVMVLSKVSIARFHNIAIYKNKELIDAFLSVLQDGQKRGVLVDTVPLYILFDVFMGFISRLGIMHTVRQANVPLNDNFDALFNILWRSMSKPELSIT
ncbi:TetR/AcrR family transcriptional regulator [Psychrobacter okhotskensis]|uniref:TetR/AcrR family transcriptional regulator n=1 Tax=Psychrobacter okhotskensis TaxID=212403 RepID=UPI00156553AE|nr:TetR/AcrR family transcriptional regulator [Psychrobacter okhotskensis]NRD70433.1 TetR/AcrR family transcriptional regulator [Psychrobacter okhotskensis]